MDSQRVNGVVRHEECMAGACVDMACGDINATMFQMQVGISTNDGIAAYLCPLVMCVLDRKLLYGWTIIRGIV